MKYQQSHPWITFHINLEKMSHDLWIKLGQVHASCELISGIPLHPDVQAHLHGVYLAKGVHATTAIEGNTLSEEQVMDRIKGVLKLPASQEYLGIEIDNIIYGCNQIKQLIMDSASGRLNYDDILEYNRIVLKNLPIDGIPGKIRNHSVGVGKYLGAPHEDCSYLLKAMCDWLNRDEFVNNKSRLVFGMLRAVLAHLNIAWIHPFADGNGRTARLLEFNILLSHGFPSSTAHLLSNHYNKTRSEYYRQLNYASRSGGDVILFIDYAVQGMLDGLKEQIDVIRGEQLRITWRNFIYDQFKDKSGSVNDRKRKLILDISENRNDGVQFRDIRHISPRIAEIYAGKTGISIRRDLKVLTQMKLLRWEKGKYYPNWRMMLSFMPERRKV